MEHIIKRITLVLSVFVSLSLSACTQAPAETPAQPPAQATQVPSEAPTQETQTPSETPAEAPTAPAGPQAMAMVGTWQRTHTEIEGDRTKNTKATVTIAGDGEDALTITFKDKEFPNENFREKALTVQEGEIHSDCGNDKWYAQVASTGKETYCVTLLPDDTLLLQCSFKIDDQPMVSYQWFARSE